MPIVNGVGYSDATQIKQQHFQNIVDVSLRIVSAILLRNSWADPLYTFIDLNAGPGNINAQDGSPQIFCSLAENYSRIKKKVTLCEINDKNADQLEHLRVDYKDFADYSIQVLRGDHNDTVPPLIPAAPIKTYGLIYNDPTGSLPSFDLLQMLADAYPLTDILIHTSASNLKRQRRAEHCPVDKRIDEYVQAINKKHWIVREPYTKFQWTFLLGTNWDGFPQFKRLGFYRADELDGAAIMRRLAYTQSERDATK